MFLGAKIADKNADPNDYHYYDLSTSAFNLFCRLLSPITDCEIYSSIEDALNHPYLNFSNFGSPSDI